MNRKGTCHRLPVVLTVYRKGLQQESKGVARRTERGCNKNRKGLEEDGFLVWFRMLAMLNRNRRGKYHRLENADFTETLETHMILMILKVGDVHC